MKSAVINLELTKLSVTEAGGGRSGGAVGVQQLRGMQCLRAKALHFRVVSPRPRVHPRGFESFLPDWQPECTSEAAKPGAFIRSIVFPLTVAATTNQTTVQTADRQPHWWSPPPRAPCLLCQPQPATSNPARTLRSCRGSHQQDATTFDHWRADGHGEMSQAHESRWGAACCAYHGCCWHPGLPVATPTTVVLLRSS